MATKTKRKRRATSRTTARRPSYSRHLHIECLERRELFSADVLGLGSAEAFRNPETGDTAQEAWDAVSLPAGTDTKANEPLSFVRIPDLPQGEPEDVAAIRVGDHVLLPNAPGQRVPVYISGGQSIQGVVLNVQIDDGYPDVPGSRADGPNITAVDLANLETIFGGVANTGNNLMETREQIWVAGTATSSGTVTAEGLLAIVTLDTTGHYETDGPWELRLADTFNGDANLQGPTGQIRPVIENGEIRIASAEAYHNPLKPADVDGNSLVTPLDALFVITRLNAEGSGQLPTAPRVSPAGIKYVDTNNDGILSPIDVLVVINELNATAEHGNGSRGEAEALTVLPPLVMQQHSPKPQNATGEQTEVAIPDLTLIPNELTPERHSSRQTAPTSPSRRVLWASDTDHLWLDSELESATSDLAADVLSAWSTSLDFGPREITVGMK